MASRHHFPRQRESGIALVLVLWGVAIAALLATPFVQSAGMEARRLTNVINAAEARAALDTGLAAGVVGLASADPSRRWRADGRLYQVTIDSTRIDVRIFAETGRIDLNTAPPPIVVALLRRVFAASGQSDQAAADAVSNAILARRGRQTNRAPSNPPPPEADRAFLSVVELSAQSGMNAEIYRRVVGAVTVHNPGGRPDWRTAGRMALAALPELSPIDIATLMANRQSGVTTPPPALAGAVGDNGAVPPNADGQVYTVRIIARTAQGATATAEAVVRLALSETTPYRILEWREPASELEP